MSLVGQTLPDQRIEGIALPAAVGNTMQALKLATAAAHHALEADRSISSGFESRNGLVRLLQRWYGFVEPYEDSLIAHAGVFEDFVRDRSHLNALTADLEYHGERDFDLLPRCSDLPKICDVDSLLGAMYVTEGSTLGGQILARHIERNLGLKDRLGYSFFLGYGNQTGRMWKEFGARVNATVSADSQLAIDAANSTFACLHRWLAA